MHLTDPSAPVPKLRIDLQVRPGSVPGVVDVGDMVTGRTFPMKDFEVSIARTLDGKRTLADAVEAARQIGIPLSAESLDKFISKLRSYGFLDESPSAAPPLRPPPAERLTWPPRAEWTDDERRLYQQSLKAFREDRPAEAKERLTVMMQRRPMAPEAKDLMARIDEALAAGPESSFARTFSDAEKSWFAQGEAQAKRAAQAALEDDEPIALPGSKKWLWALPALGVVGAMAIPVTRERTLPATLTPAKATEVRAPHAGKLEAVLVKEGQDVKSGDALARFDGTDAKKEADKLTAKVTSLERQVKQLEALAKSPKVTRAKAQQAKRDAALAKATADRDKLSARARGKRTPALTKAEKQVAALQAASQKGAAEVDALSQTKALASAHGELQAATQAKSALASQAHDPTVAAPLAGAVLKVTPAPRAVAADELLASIGDLKTLHARFKVADDEQQEVSSGEAVTLAVDGKSVAGTVSSVGVNSQGGEVDVVADIPNPGGKLAPGASCSVRLALGSQALVKRLLSR